MARTIICAAAAAALGALTMTVPAQAMTINAGLNAAAPAAVQDVGYYRGHRWRRGYRWRHRYHHRYRHCWRDRRGFRHCVWR